GRYFTHQSVQADAISYNRGVTLVLNHLPVEQRETAQRCDSLIEPVIDEGRREGLTKFLSPLQEQEQRDRLRREQRNMNDQRLSGGMEFCRLIDGKRKRLRHRQTIVILGGRVAHVIEEFCRRSLEAPRIFGKRNVESLAVGRRLLMREWQAA